ncbi:MAG: hypothetical protein ACSHW0_10415 [Thalassotalea sp.]
MIKYFLAALLFIVTCSTMEQGNQGFSHKSSVDQSTLFDVDLSAKNESQEDTDPLNFFISRHPINADIKHLLDNCASEQQGSFVLTRYSINTRAPPLLA